MVLTYLIAFCSLLWTDYFCSFFKTMFSIMLHNLVFKNLFVALFFSDDISLEGLQQELEECKNDDVTACHFVLLLVTYIYCFVNCYWCISYFWLTHYNVDVLGGSKHIVQRNKITGLHKGCWKQFTTSWIGLYSGLLTILLLLFLYIFYTKHIAYLCLIVWFLIYFTSIFKMVLGAIKILFL